MIRTRLLWLLPPLVGSAPAFALQTIDARDGVTVEAVLSIKEPTRIRIEGAPITDVFGNIYTTNCGSAAPPAPGATGPAPPAVNPSGEIVLECDRDKGEIYVRPVGQGTKPVNLFVSSAHATYTLLLRRSDTPADTIVIRDKMPRQPRSGDPSSPFAQPLGRSANHIRSLKSMLMVMSAERVPSDIRVEELNRPVQLWAEARFSLMRVFEGRGYIGEKYLLTNVSSKPMVLAEQEFDRQDGNVLGVTVETHNLRPGESTYVYVIRAGS